VGCPCLVLVYVALPGCVRVQASVLAGHTSAAEQILAMPALVSGLRGTTQQQYTQVLALMADELKDGPQANAEPVWRTLYEQGCVFISVSSPTPLKQQFT
jgi:hypothetical protein